MAGQRPHLRWRATCSTTAQIRLARRSTLHPWRQPEQGAASPLRSSFHMAVAATHGRALACPEPWKGPDGAGGGELGQHGVGARRATLTCAVVVLILFTRCQATQTLPCGQGVAAHGLPPAHLSHVFRPLYAHLPPPCVCPAARAGVCASVWLCCGA